MKKRLLALVCAAVMTFGMSLTVCAAGSPNATQAASNSNTSAVSNDTQTVSDAPVISNNTQTLTAATIAGFAVATTASGNATVTAVSNDVAVSAVTEANAVYGTGSFVATVVDVSLPAGTVFPYELTLSNPNVWAGQTITILHYVNGAWEKISPSKVADGSVTFTITSCSPFAVVIDSQASPKTMDPSLAVSGLAGLFAAGAVLTGKKKEQ